MRWGWWRTGVSVESGDSELPDAVTRGRTQRKGQNDLTAGCRSRQGANTVPKLLEAIDWAT